MFQLIRKYFESKKLKREHHSAYFYLSRNYGKSDYYSEGQIERFVSDFNSKESKNYYAMFLNSQTFQRKFKNTSYEDLREQIAKKYFASSRYFREPGNFFTCTKSGGGEWPDNENAKGPNGIEMAAFD